uniref:Ig-like domain-containing protein n=1 Tax=Rhodnius prolixus TaxID=13249 RepID=T1HBN8_RHOPR
MEIVLLVPELNIADERGLPIKNKFYNSGSTIELKCIVSKVPEPTHIIMWRHGEKVLNYDTSRGGISVKTDIMDDGAMSRLFIANSNQHDSGNYTCSLGDIAHASVAVVVLNEMDGFLDEQTLQAVLASV